MTPLPAVNASQSPAILVGRLWEDESGQDQVEYALVAAFIGLGTVTGIRGIAATVAGFMNFIYVGFNGAISGQI